MKLYYFIIYNIFLEGGIWQKQDKLGGRGDENIYNKNGELIGR
jgi:hypothetical protein